MTNRLQAYVPAVFRPTDPAVADSAWQDDRARKLTAFAALSSAMLLVILVAVLMGMT
jgi:hypothetical protein